MAIQLLLEQKITALVNRYEYFDFSGGTKGEMLAVAEQKRFKLREEIEYWNNRQDKKLLFRFKAASMFDVHGRYEITDDAGKPVGYLKKAFAASLLKSTWEVYAPDDTLLFTAQESNAIVAIIRRLGGFIPYVGALIEQLPFNFVFMREGTQVGTHKRVFGLKDHYEITLEGVEADRRLVMALGVALDALQQR